MGTRRWVAVAVLAMASGCFGSNEDTSGAGDGGVASEGSTGTGGSSGSSGGGSGSGSGITSGGPTGGPSCLFSSVTAELAVTNVDRVDLLFVVDNSASMREEQVALRAQFPKLIRVLTTGDRDGDGIPDFSPAKDLHLAVVSSDMGLVNIQGIPGCDGLGDDGIMNNIPGPNVAGCQASYPRFLSYTAGVHDPGQTATDFACIADLGTDGCGFEQQLEAGLKALWPMTYRDPETGAATENPILFLGDVNGFGTFGHGDVENNGFLRNDPVQGISLIGIVMVSDEEDCSSADTRHFTPDVYLPDGDPLRDQDLNLRCFYNPQNLYVLDRYVNGFRALRPGNENLVMFGAIVGVPPDLVDADALSRVDFTDAVQRNGFYDQILADPRMQEVPDPTRSIELGGILTPSCDTPTGLAFPPRRFVQVAQRFGENGLVQSICQDDFGPAVDNLIGVLSKQLGAVCLPRKLARDGDGLVGCQVLWELPTPNLAPANTPTTCGERDYLMPPDEGTEAVTSRGGQVCKVAQLAVVNSEFRATDGFDAGWYYDDFSDEVAQGCHRETPQRIAFTPEARPPTGVTVKLQCANVSTTVSARSDVQQGIDQPSLGSPCDGVVLNGTPVMGDEACAVRLSAPDSRWPDGIDRSMFCHPELNVCVLACSVDADCPRAWVCDDSPATLQGTAGSGRMNGSPICKNQCDAADGVGTATAEVGSACLPDSVPQDGFDDREAYVQSGTEDCGGGACLVFRLRGDPRSECVDGPVCSPEDPDCTQTRCATPNEVRDRIYCSCRCDGPEGEGPFCACPDDFSCVAAVEQGPAGIAGSYCVRNGTFSR